MVVWAERLQVLIVITATLRIGDDVIDIVGVSEAAAIRVIANPLTTMVIAAQDAQRDLRPVQR
jgi:hypothetical protein